MQRDSPDFIDNYMRSGFFTHCYLEAGYLNQKEPITRIFRAKDDRRYVFDLASLTKALVTAPLIHKFIDSRYLENADGIKGPVIGDFSRGSSNFEFPNELKKLSIYSLLSHSSGLPAWLNFWLGQLGPQERYKILCEKRNHHIVEVLKRTAYLWHIKQDGDCYSDVGFIILGALLESFNEQALDQLFSDFMSNDIGMRSSRSDFCFPTPFIKKHPIYITSSFCPIRQRWLKGEVHDENCAALGGVAGHAGLFGSGPRFSEYLKMFANSMIGQRFLAQNESMRLKSKALPGLRLGDDVASREFCAGDAMGHWGFTGTGFWLHLPSLRYAIVLTNRVISGRLSSKTQIFRKEALCYLNKLFS